MVARDDPGTPGGLGWTEGQRERWARQRAIAYMTAHPWTTARRAALKFADFWGLEREYVAALRQGKYTPPLWFAALSSAAMAAGYVSCDAAGVRRTLRPLGTDWQLHVVPLLILAVFAASTRSCSGTRDITCR